MNANMSKFKRGWISVEKFWRDNPSIASLRDAHEIVQNHLFGKGYSWLNWTDSESKEVRCTHALYLYFNDDGNISWDVTVELPTVKLNGQEFTKEELLEALAKFG